MQKLYISTNKNGKYYTKIKNTTQGCEKILSVWLPKDTILNVPYGDFDCEYKLGCYKTKDGGVEICIYVTKIWQDQHPIENSDVNPYAQYKDVTNDLPF